ncbi:MAG: CHAT domain-containing protein [Acidobacteria bacterium]|nr:CHAT domain-containing protein [Acidobacteriota bacterium]
MEQQPPGKLKQLPWTRREAERIARLYDDQQVSLFLGERASEENVKAEDWLGNHRFVHFAAHGLLNENEPQFSGLILSIPQVKKSVVKDQRSERIRPREKIAGLRRETTDRTQVSKNQEQPTGVPEDGLLQVYEIFNLKMNADMVVLSAWETGLGKEVKGEGLIGLTRAFMYAGVQSVVASLWRVADRSTADLMVKFYQRLDREKSKAEALREAKLEMIQSRRYAHPSLWAPFVLVGEPAATSSAVSESADRTDPQPLGRRGVLPLPAVR